MSEAEPTFDVAALTVQLLSAYLANNTVPSEDLAGLIRSTRDALTQGADTLSQGEPETFMPAVSVRKSLASPDHIISLIDGKPYKTLKRHLSGHGLTPEAYRSRYNLPANYPMVAPTYGEHRRNIAKEAGLGTRKPAVEETAIAKTELPLGANLEDARASEPQAAAKGIADTEPSTSTNKSKAERKSKAPTSDEATVDQVAPTYDADPTSAAEHDTSSAEATQQGLVDDPTPTTSNAKAIPSAKKQGAKAPPAKSPKSRPGKPKRNVAIKPAPSADSASDALSKAADEQDLQTTVTKPKRRAKLGLFEKTEAKPSEPANGSATQTAETSSAPQEPASGEASDSVKTPTKRQSLKRMARTPKTPGSEGHEASNEDEAGD